MRTDVLDRIARTGAAVTQAKADRQDAEAAERARFEAELATKLASYDDKIQRLERELARLVLSASDETVVPDAAAAEEARSKVASKPVPSKRITVKQQAMDWFLAHPDATARVGDLVKAGIGKSTNALRPTIHRLWEDDNFLEKVAPGQFRLAKTDSEEGRAA